MKVLFLTDGMGWVVDRDCQEIVNHLPEIEFKVLPYIKITVEDFVEQANNYDIVHYYNWDIYRLRHALDRIEKPLLMSVHSHRYNKFTKEVYKRPNTWFHVINKYLLEDFPNAIYIPNGIFDQFKPNHEFTVGCAVYKNVKTHDYKGIGLIKQACEELGIKFKPALGNINPEDMPDYYRSLDLYVCASEAEGFSTPVMECMAMNVPIITTDVGVPRQFDLLKVKRSVEGVKRGIRAFYTAGQVEEYKWSSLAYKYRNLYEEIYNS